MDITNFNKENIQFYTETLWDKIKSRQGLGNYDGTPVGTVISYMGATPPEGYLACDGAIYNVALYPELVKHIRENFGSINFFGGDGTTTFAVPDLRGEFLRGTGIATRNSGGGANVGIHQPPTQQVNILSGLDETKNSWIGNIVKQGINSKGHVNRILDYDKKINTPQTGVGTFYVADPIDLASDQNWLGIDFKNEPVMYTSRPTNTSVLYCIKYQTTFSKKEIKYLINTDTLKLIADENRCYLYLDNYAIQENNKLIKIPSGYEPIFDSFYVVTNNDSGITAMTPTFLRIYKNGETTIQAFADGAVIEDMKKGNFVHGSASWFYKEISG